MRVLGKMWAMLAASRTRRVIAVLTLICLLLAVQILTHRSTSETVIEDSTRGQGLLPVVEQQQQQSSSSQTSAETEGQSAAKSEKDKASDLKKQQQNKAKEELLKNFSALDTKQLQKLWRMLDSTKDPHSVPEIRINQALQSLKIRLLEEVSGKKYPLIMDAAHKALALSEHPRPEPLQIVISTTWRSGSTFLEELLASHPAVYNHYEPLMQFGLRQIRDGDDSDKAQKLVHSLLLCNYNGQDDYINTAVKIRDMFSRNTVLWQFCSSDDYGDAMCYNESFLRGACRLFPWATMKLVRLRLKLLRPVLEDQKLNVRIVYLVRDPRGVINSRVGTVKWCSSKDCNDPSYLCADMDDDLTAAIQLQKDFPGRVYTLRYEDLSLNPVNKTKELLDYLGLDFDPKMKEFLDSHTTKNYDKPWSTSRESKKRVTYWVTKLDDYRLKAVQDACSPVMKRFGYLPIDSNKNISVPDILGPLVLPNS